MQARPMQSCGVRPSVCVSVTFVHSVKRNKDIFKKISQPGSHTILGFSVPNGMAIFRRKPSNWDVECRGVGRNRDSEPISGFTAYCEAFQRQVQYT